MTNPFLGNNLNLRKISFIFRFGPLADNWSNKRTYILAKCFTAQYLLRFEGQKIVDLAGVHVLFWIVATTTAPTLHIVHTAFPNWQKRMDNVQKTERDWNSCQIEKQTKWSNLKRAQPLSPWVSNNRLIGFWLIRFSSGLKVNITLHAKFSYQ